MELIKVEDDYGTHYEVRTGTPIVTVYDLSDVLEELIHDGKGEFEVNIGPKLLIREHVETEDERKQRLLVEATAAYRAERAGRLKKPRP